MPSIVEIVADLPRSVTGKLARGRLRDRESARRGTSLRGQDRADHTVTLLSKPGCHLCDDARVVIAAVTGELGVPWDEVDITTDDELYARYWEQIPVTLVDGVQHDFWRVSPRPVEGRAHHLTDRRPVSAPCAVPPNRRRHAGGYHPRLTMWNPGGGGVCSRVHKCLPLRRTPALRAFPQPPGSPVTAPRSPRAAARGRGFIPDATVARLPVYLRALVSYSERGVPTVSSEELATAAGVNSAKLRKDLSYLGSYGTRGVGYDVEYLLYQVSRELGLTQDWAVVIVGIGSLGQALANYGGFSSRGFRIVALVDAEPSRVGQTIAGVAVESGRQARGGRRAARRVHRGRRDARQRPPRRCATGWSPPASRAS